MNQYSVPGVSGLQGVPGLGAPLMPTDVPGGLPGVAQARCMGTGAMNPTIATAFLAAELMVMEQLMAMMTMMLFSLLRRGAGAGLDGAQVPGLRGVSAPTASDGSSSAAGPASGKASSASAPAGSAPTPGDGTQPKAMRQGKPIGANIADAFDRMVAAAKKDGVDLRIVSGYRTHAEQEALWARNPNPKMVARPGTSNHEKGNAIDFANTSGAYAWLKKNAARFGLHNYPAEAWHYSLDGH